MMLFETSVGCKPSKKIETDRIGQGIDFGMHCPSFLTRQHGEFGMGTSEI